MAGQIIKRGERKFLVRIPLGMDANGKRKYHNHTVHGSKKDAERYKTQKLRELDIGEFIEPTKETVAEYIDKWLETSARQRVREKTFVSYKQLMDRYIKPAIGDQLLSQVKPEEIQGIYNDMLDRGLSPRTIKYTNTVFKSALNQAVKWGKLYRNPADLVDLPREEKKEMRALSPDEAARFMEIIIYSKHKAFFSLLISTGMRPSEALALKWKDIDMENSRLTVNRVLSRTRNQGWKLEEPKTTRSRRTIPIPKQTLEDLKEYQQEQKEIKMKHRKTYNDMDFVFASETGEPLHERSLIGRHFKPLLKDANLPDIRLYDLRHTCATLLLAAGENPKVVSERLGHTSITLTLDTYSHVLPDMQESATEKLEGILFKEGT